MNIFLLRRNHSESHNAGHRPRHRRIPPSDNNVLPVTRQGLSQEGGFRFEKPVSCSGKILQKAMTLFWAQPPDYPPVAIVPYYLYAIAGKFSVQLMPGHRNAP